MKLYTRQGDDGHTALFGGTRVPKNDSRVCAYGEVDECNAAIGVVIAQCSGEETSAILQQVQSDLFMLGAELATREHQAAGPRIGDAHVAQLERWIDATSEEIPPLKNFVLPGGTEVAAALHAARTVCRRAERAAVALAAQETIRPAIIVFLNRLGDLLFALARRANHQAGLTDIPWIPPKE